jgi:hypothetical protein
MKLSVFSAACGCVLPSSVRTHFMLGLNTCMGGQHLVFCGGGEVCWVGKRSKYKQNILTRDIADGRRTESKYKAVNPVTDEGLGVLLCPHLINGHF